MFIYALDVLVSIFPTRRLPLAPFRYSIIYSPVFFISSVLLFSHEDLKPEALIKE